MASAKELIAAGDIYQVNLAQRFFSSLPLSQNLLPYYARLRERSPAPMSAYLRQGHREVCSSSPELFLHLKQDHIETRPIKGTRPRFPEPEKDAHSAKELCESAKEQAELLMITDLLRNDLGQICKFGTVQVKALASLETLAHVHHLTSIISGKIHTEHNHLDALRACLPGGSITGAPKKRAREIIADLEPSPRGLYTGVVGYLGLNRESQFNIAIRTAIREKENIQFHVGAGIVADSDPELEYEETLHKARGIHLAFS